MGGDDTLLSSTDGQTWTELTPIQLGLRVIQLQADDGNPGRWLAVLYDAVQLTGGELWSSDTAGTTWNPVPGWPAGSRGQPVYGY